MSKVIKKYLTLLSFILLAFLSNLKTNAGLNNTANGEWQYLIKRGDTKGRGGSMSNPNCPFYIGYFSLSFQKFEPNKKGKYAWQPEFMYAMKARGSGTPLYAIGKNSYELKGSYVPMDDDKYCKSPLTQAQTEKAPIRMVKISSDGKQLEWITDFQKGSQGGNAIWRSKAKFDGANSMTGVLKAYICDGEGKNRGCTLLNTATFTAKKIKSIEQASGKPLFEKAIGNSPLTSLYLWLTHLFDRSSNLSFASPNGEEIGFVPDDYLKPSIKAVFPALAVNPAYAATNGREICIKLLGSGDNPCKVCKTVGTCQNGEVPEEENVCCFGNCDGVNLCKTDCAGSPNDCIDYCTTTPSCI